MQAIGRVVRATMARRFYNGRMYSIATRKIPTDGPGLKEFLVAGRNLSDPKKMQPISDVEVSSIPMVRYNICK